MYNPNNNELVSRTFKMKTFVVSKCNKQTNKCKYIKSMQRQKQIKSTESSETHLNSYESYRGRCTKERNEGQTDIKTNKHFKSNNYKIVHKNKMGIGDSNTQQIKYHPLTQGIVISLSYSLNATESFQHKEVVAPITVGLCS